MAQHRVCGSVRVPVNKARKTMARLDGKVVLLTGAGAGIAKATAKACVREGARVALLEIDREAGSRAEQEIDQAGGEALFIPTDVTQDVSVRDAVEATVRRFGRLDVLFNCAGGSLQEDVPVHQMDLDVWNRTVALNLLHPFLVCRHGIPHMMKAGAGSIVNVTSHMGLMGSQKPAYAACKGGIVSFTKTLAAQYVQYGIRANAIAPGSVRTERQIKRYENKEFMGMDKPTPQALERAAFHKLYPFSKGEPEDIAAIAVFLASDESRMLTGTTIAADGGRSSYLKVYTEQA
ncbi:MAG: SDR family oxidoreductase [Betaproteobacteria bacterium]|nr:MAG: SDR family oxidoreductase [Betaproteobacteria bacterium]